MLGSKVLSDCPDSLVSSTVGVTDEIECHGLGFINNFTLTTTTDHYENNHSIFLYTIFFLKSFLICLLIYMYGKLFVIRISHLSI